MTPGKKKLGCTVVLTVMNDAAALARTLHTLETQTRLPEELILAVADSQDNTLGVAQNCAAKHSWVKILQVGKATRSQGRNLAVQGSSQKIIVFTDAGCLPEPEWLAELLVPFQNAETALVSGLTVVSNTSSFAEAQGAFVLVPPGKIDKHPLPATRNMALRKSTFLQHQGFREELNFAEDYEFARRLQTVGVHSEFAPQAVVAWEARDSIRDYFSMILRLTQGDIQAETWRRGHITMWLRYLVLFMLGFITFLVTNSLISVISFTTILYLGYLLLKLSRFQFSRSGSYFWAILLQVLTDMAVLLGSARGVWHRRRIK